MQLSPEFAQIIVNIVNYWFHNQLWLVGLVHLVVLFVSKYYRNKKRQLIAAFNLFVSAPAKETNYLAGFHFCPNKKT